jgi:hypothetical protein
VTWIAIRRPGPDDPELSGAMERAMTGYPSEYSPERRGERRMPELVANDSIVASHSLIPPVLEHIFSAHRAMMDPNLPLDRRQHELIAATVSGLNRCFY